MMTTASALSVPVGGMGLAPALITPPPPAAKPPVRTDFVEYDDIRYVPEDQDPSITLETASLVAKVIDNTGLLVPADSNARSYMGKYGVNSPVPFSHHLGYHGIRTLYDKTEKRNLVVPLISWLNLQGVRLTGIENDPVDARAWAGVGRGWPMRMERKGAGVVLILDPRPNTQFRYSIEFQPAEPDGIDFSIRLVFHKKPAKEPARFRGSWPCYVNAFDDVRFYYPRGKTPQEWKWDSLGKNPDIVIGEPVGYKHRQEGFRAEDQVLPVGFGRIGHRVLILMFDDPKVRFFMVNSGGHYSISAIQNPAWDFEWVMDDYPLDKPVGFNGRLVYTVFDNEEKIMRRYREWVARSG
jgi:hypothetical protein